MPRAGCGAACPRRPPAPRWTPAPSPQVQFFANFSTRAHQIGADGAHSALAKRSTPCFTGEATHAGDMIGEVTLAIEIGADAVDIGKTIHPHPILGESIGMAAEVAHDSYTDVPSSKK